MTGPPSAHNLLRSVVKNAVSLTGGRILIAALRFVVALVIVQRAGLDRFGEFALILSFVLVAEWLSDFGLSDIAVRQITADPRRTPFMMGAFLVSKAAQGALAGAAMWGAIALAGYPVHVVRAGLIACAAVILFSGVQVYRVQFRANLQMGRDVGAELVAGIVFFAAIWVATGADASLEVLTLCYVLSRAVNLAVAALLADARPKVAFGPEFRTEMRVLLASCVPLGITGLMVSAYDSMDQIALAHWSTPAEVGVFTIAVRVMMLAVVAQQAIAGAVFPVLAALWAQDRDAFKRTMQAVLEWGTLIGGAIFCTLYAGALGVGALAKQDPHAIAAVLQLLSWAILARVIVTLVSPMVVISGHLRYAVWMSATVVLAKFLALIVLAPRGASGAAIAYLIAEIGVGLVPTVLLCQRSAGMRLQWSVPLRVIALAAAVALTMKWLGLEGSLAHGVLAGVVYVALAAAIGAIRMEPLKQLYLGVARRRSGNA